MHRMAAKLDVPSCQRAKKISIYSNEVEKKNSFNLIDDKGPIDYRNGGE